LAVRLTRSRGFILKCSSGPCRPLDLILHLAPDSQVNRSLVEQAALTGAICSYDPGDSCEMLIERVNADAPDDWNRLIFDRRWFRLLMQMHLEAAGRQFVDK